MLKYIVLLASLCTMLLHANDGAYTLSGNQLIPIHESDISIKKEVLTITRLDDETGTLDVKVEYTFFNPSEAKTVLVGFEAAEPEGDIDTRPVNGGHPSMKRFSVLMNGKKIPFKIDINEGKYDKNGSNIGYVYYFNALFNKGSNKIVHHYTYEHSSGVAINYEFDYILTAASRWAGSVIEDFTLIIDVGDFTEFEIVNSFFKSGKEWELDGTYKNIKSYIYNDKEATLFFLRKSLLVFKKKNFKINGDLWLVSENFSKGQIPYVEVFDYKKVKLLFSGILIENIFPKDRVSYKIYKNFFYAQRGYIFKDPVVQNYYDGLDWYEKNPRYKPSKPFIDKELNSIALNILKNIPYAKRGYVFKNDKLKYFFKNQKWYKPNAKYKSNFSDLPKSEQAWIAKIKRVKNSDNMDFYMLLDEYEKIYKDRVCLQPSDEKEIQVFLNKLVRLVDKNSMKQVFSDVMIKDFSPEVKEFYKGILSDELSSKGYAKYSFKKQSEYVTRKASFLKSLTKKGCYEYVLFHDYNPPVSEAEFSTWIVIIKTEDGFKISKIEMAG